MHLNTLTKEDIVAGLRGLGIVAGDSVLVHSSVASLGKVEGGAETVIDAIIEAVGPDGLVVMPTFACKAPFDRKNSRTPLGAMSDKFWRRPGAVRSLHPTHSVAAIGRGAADLISDHEKAPTAYGEGTPYYKLALSGGKILLLGVDQDRNTTLHTAETLVNAPYLCDIEATYIDDIGIENTIPVAAMAGPHRDFISLDGLFAKSGVMTRGKIGRGVCRLMDTKRMLEVAVQALTEDPAAVLCDNPACTDCVMQRGKIKAAKIKEEDFTLAAVAGEISTNIREILAAVSAQGISALELTAHEYEAFKSDLGASSVRVAAIRGAVDDAGGASLAAELGVPFVAHVTSAEDLQAAARLGGHVLAENAGISSAQYAEACASGQTVPKIAFNPGEFAACNEMPFLGVFYKGLLRNNTAHFYMNDGTFDGEPVLPGMGNGEVKEILSMLRCRGYDGVVTLRSCGGVEGFRKSAEAFWRIMARI